MTIFVKKIKTRAHLCRPPWWPGVKGCNRGRCNRCSCIGPRGSWVTAPWCLRRLFIISRYPLRSRIQ